MKRLKSNALMLGTLFIGAISLSGCATKEYVDQQVATVNGRIDQQEAHLAQLDKTTQEALDRAAAAGKLAEGKFVYSVVLTDDSIKFTTGRAVLTDEAKAKLTQLADQLKTDNKNVYIEIQGYTDATGTDDNNYKLGADRANSVRRFLSQQGVALNRMSAISYGAEQPVAPNNTDAGRSANRRVVVVVLS